MGCQSGWGQRLWPRERCGKRRPSCSYLSKRQRGQPGMAALRRSESARGKDGREEVTDALWLAAGKCNSPCKSGGGEAKGFGALLVPVCWAVDRQKMLGAGASSGIGVTETCAAVARQPFRSAAAASTTTQFTPTSTRMWGAAASWVVLSTAPPPPPFSRTRTLLVRRCFGAPEWPCLQEWLVHPRRGAAPPWGLDFGQGII
jgi:hypothetical protein